MQELEWPRGTAEEALQQAAEIKGQPKCRSPSDDDSTISARPEQGS